MFSSITNVDYIMTDGSPYDRDSGVHEKLVRQV